jgi:phosphopantetheinyl transferase
MVGFGSQSDTIHNRTARRQAGMRANADNRQDFLAEQGFGHQHVPGLIPFGPDASGMAALCLRTTGHAVILAENHAESGFLPPALPGEVTATSGSLDPTGYLLRRRIARAIGAEALANDRGAAANALRIDASPSTRTRFGNGETRLHLSFAAREGVNLIGIARRRIGVDLEPLTRLEAIPWNILRPDEAEEIKALPENRRLQRFLTLWTSKEAILKAQGTGFTTPPEALRINRDGSVEHRQATTSDAPWLKLRLELSHHAWHDVFHNIFCIAIALLPEPDAAPFAPDHS